MDQAVLRGAVPPPRRMGRDEYRRWAEAQPRGRWERVDGEVIAMNAQTVGHAWIKVLVWQALDRAIRAAGVPCQALGDGVTVAVGGDTDYEPDAVVNCGAVPRLDALDAPNPVVVVEVTSPASQSVDAGEKLSGYFGLPAVQHYLMVRSRRREVVHCRRVDDRIEARILTAGPIVLDPPGIAVTVEEFYAGLDL